MTTVITTAANYVVLALDVWHVMPASKTNEDGMSKEEFEKLLTAFKAETTAPAGSCATGKHFTRTKP